MSSTLVVALAALCAAPSLAQSPPSPEPSTLPEIGRVVTSDRHDEAASTTAKTTYVVTKTDIVRRGFTTVADALEDVPGVVVTRNGPVGSLNGVAIRGTSPNQTLVLLDGRPLGGAQIGTLDLGALPTAGIERIEVVEGSGATLYGTGAIGGVINIVTAPGARRDTLATLRTATFGESALTIDTPHLVFERRVARNSFAFPAYGTDPGGARDDVDLASTMVRARTGAHAGDVAVALDAGIVARHLGVPGSVTFGVTPNARQDDVGADARATFTRATSRGGTTLDLSGTRDAVVYRDPLAAESFTGAPFAYLNTEARLQASLRNVVQNDAGALVYGVDLAHGSARIDGGDGNPPVHGFAQTAIYAQDQQRFGALRAYAGLRAERDGGQGGALAPSLGGVLSFGSGLWFRANASTAFRAPTAVDLYYPGFSNPNLQPERTKNFDASIGDDRLLGGAHLGYFVTAGDNLIVATSTSVENVQRALINGLTFDIRTRPFHGFTTTVSFTDLYRAQNRTAGDQRLPRRPVIVSNVELAYAGGARSMLTSAGVIAHSVGLDTDPFGTAQPFTRIDAYTRLRVAPRALVTLRVYDLGNERYEEVGGFPMPGRTFALELSTR